MLEAALRLTLRNFSTLFLLVATVVLPLHLLYAVAFSEVISLREFAAHIEQAPVRDVSSQDVDRSRLAFWALTALEIALIPLAARAAHRIVEVDRRGEVATVWDGWRHAFGRIEGAREDAPGSRLPAVAGALLIALAAGFLVGRIGSLFVPLFPADLRFVAVALVDAGARALGAPLPLVALALARDAPPARAQE